jgi:hypothetical protein
MFKNTASQKWVVFAFQDEGGANPGEPVTGDAANITANLRLDGGAANAVDDTNPTELEDGYYIFDITAAESNADNIVIAPASATANVNVIGVPGVVFPRENNDEALVDLVWDEVITGASHNGVNSAGRRLRQASEVTPVLNEGTAQAGAAGTITLAAAAEGTNDDLYEDAYISIISGTGAGQIRAILSYTASTRVATVHENWIVTPDNTSVYVVAGSSASNVHAVGDSVTAANNLLADYDGTGYDKSNSTIGTTTTNTDMRGTDNAATAASLTTVEGKVDTVDANVDSILADTGTDGVVISATTANEIADALLNRDMSAVSDTTARSPLNALRLLRNKYSISGTTLTVTKEDDSTAAWTSALTTDAAADPVTGSDPA